MEILMISAMTDMGESASSTQIMVYNLIYGLHIGHNAVTFLPIVDKGCLSENIIQEFKGITSNTIVVPSALNALHSGAHPLKNVMKQLYFMGFNGWYLHQLKKSLKNCQYDLIIAHVPTVESVFYAEAAKKICGNAKMIQYWSDPYARSGLSGSEPVPIKRTPMVLIESQILKVADEIVYGTEVLYQTQACQYPQYSAKMRPCDVSYNIYNLDRKEDVPFSNKYVVCGYIGNYFQRIRNIEPCYQAFKNNKELGNFVLCGAGDVEVSPQSNISLIQRCSPAKATAIENGLDILICLLNVRTSQIPGKIFYQTNSGKPIIVILDGPDRKQIHEYLKKFNRFEFCENNEQSIASCLSRVKAGRLTASLKTPESLSPSRFANRVCGNRVYP